MRTDDLKILHALDAAPRVPFDTTAQIRAEAGLQRILATEPGLAGRRPERARPSSRVRWVAIPAAAAVVAGTWVLPGWLGADDAYASWTAVPSTLSTGDRSVADRACRGVANDLDDPALDLAERRGDWVGMLYTSVEAYPDDPAVPVSTMCLVRLPVGGDKATEITVGSGGGQGAVPTGGQFTEGPIAEYGPSPFDLTPRPTFSFISGDVGDDVVGLAIGTPDGQVVQASVDGGRYVAWWPGKAFGDRTEGNGGPAPGLSYTITLRDGTVVDSAEPTTP